MLTCVGRGGGGGGGEREDVSFHSKHVGGKNVLKEESRAINLHARRLVTARGNNAKLKKKPDPFSSRTFDW